MKVGSQVVFATSACANDEEPTDYTAQTLDAAVLRIGTVSRMYDETIHVSASNGAFIICKSAANLLPAAILSVYKDIEEIVDMVVYCVDNGFIAKGEKDRTKRRVRGQLEKIMRAGVAVHLWEILRNPSSRRSCFVFTSNLFIPSVDELAHTTPTSVQEAIYAMLSIIRERQLSVANERIERIGEIVDACLTD